MYIRKHLHFTAHPTSSALDPHVSAQRGEYFNTSNTIKILEHFKGKTY